MARFAVNPAWSDVPATSALMTARVRRDYFVEDYRTPLTIKAVASGQSLYETPLGRYLVTPETFLVLNAGQHYAMDVPASWGTTTLCPFFAPGFASAAVSACGGRTAVLETEFCERLYPMTPAVSQALATMRGGTPEELEDGFHDLALALAALHVDVRREIARFPAARASTREELYRRLHRGRDFLASSYDERVSVADAARAAAMSPFHFHRAFKAAFGVTPMQYLQARRLEVARRMLARGAAVTETCFAVGFESLGSFSSLFRRRFGVPPSKAQF